MVNFRKPVLTAGLWSEILREARSRGASDVYEPRGSSQSESDATNEQGSGPMSEMFEGAGSRMAGDRGHRRRLPRFVASVGVMMAVAGGIVAFGFAGPASATPAGFVCPAQDNQGFALGQSFTSAGTLECSYPIATGADPKAGFFCDYDSTTGDLTLDVDDDLCPANANAGTPVALPTISTSQQPEATKVGGKIADQATVSGGDSPTGTVTFDLYDNSNAVGTPLFTDTETLSGGVATSTDYTTTAVGGVYWFDTYNGDHNNSLVYNPTYTEPVDVELGPGCPSAELYQGFALGTSDLTTDPIFCSYPLTPNEDPNDFYCTYDAITGALVTDHGNGHCFPATVGFGKSTPAITTLQQPASATIGGSIADQATVSGGKTPTGTVTFKLYTNSTANGTALFTDTETLSGGVATSTGYTTAATGTDYWVATYNGDHKNNSVASSTSGEPVSIKPAPTITTTQQPASTIFGRSIADKATASGGNSPTGTITFNLYSNSTASGTPLFTDTKTLSGGAATSAGYTPTAIGTYYWVATYNGDANNGSASSTTNGEPVTITKAPTTLTALPQLILFRPLAGVGSNVVAATLTSGGSPVVGQSVSFNDGATHLCTATTNSAGLARCTISSSGQALVLRTNSYTATFAGTTNYVGSTSTTLTITFF
jgi:hypothetical protein